MKKRVSVRVAGTEYPLITDESEEYVKQVADIVNSDIKALTETGKISKGDAVVLSCFNYCDKLQKETGMSEHLREQVKSHLDTNTKLKLELADVRREITRLKQKAQNQD